MDIKSHAGGHVDMLAFINPHKSVGTAQNNDVYNQLLFYYTRSAGIHFDKATRAKHYGRTWCLRY